MILSSADILRILGGNSIIRLAAKLQVVDGKPALSGREGLYIYIERFPKLAEFEATFTLWIESDGSEPDDIVVAELKKLLPKVQVVPGLMTKVTATEFRSESTLEAPAAAPAPQVDMSVLEARFEALAEDIQDQMLLLHSGGNGQDVKDGRDGVDGRDGRDMVATDAHLFDLQDVEQGIAQEKGQVLTWDGVKWTNLFVPQILSSGGGGNGSTTFVASTGTAIQWKYHGSSSEVEPQSRHFHSDTTDTDIASVFHVSKTNNAGNDVELLLDELLRTATRIYISQVSDPSLAHLFQIDSYTETATGYEINVTHLETAGPEVDFEFSKVYEFLFLGQDGTGGGATSIDDLTDVDTSSTAPLPGQTLVWNGTDWVPGNFASGGGIPDAPADGNYYVRYNGTWVNLADALALLMIGDGGQFSPFGDGGNFTVNYAGTAYAGQIDGSNFSTGATGAADDEIYDGGYWR